jgi:5'-nucleotidase
MGRLMLSATMLLLAAAPMAALSANAAEKRLRILVTNDDGFQSRGIRVLTERLGTFAEVLRVAPVNDQSGASQSTTILKGETWVIPHRRDGKLVGYEVEGTPADAVRFGIMILGKNKKFDFVVSGINKGGNVGHINLYSGTIGAAMEAMLHGVPALAVSQSSRRKDNFDLSARLAAKTISQMAHHGAPKDVLLSVNVPSGQVRGVKIMPARGLVLKVTGFKRQMSDGRRVKYKPVLKFERNQPDDSDSAAYLQKFATVTPIRVDRTAYDAIPALRQWDFDLPKAKDTPTKN